MCGHRRGRLRPLVLILPLALRAFPSPAEAQGLSFGPLTTEEGGPLQRVAYTPATEPADLVGAGNLKADLWMGYSNIFEQDSATSHELFLDLERLITTVGVRYGLTDRVEIGGRLTFETTGGGILDGFISQFHQTFGLGNANRDKYPTGDYAQRLRDDSGDLLDVPRRHMALEDVRLFAKWHLLGEREATRALSLRAVTRIPTQENVAGAERADVALVAHGRLSGRRWHAHVMAGGTTVRAASAMGGALHSSGWFLSTGAERRLGSWISALVQYHVATPVMRGIGDSEVDGWPANLVFGLAGSLGESWRWDVSFQEDIPPGSPAVDFTLGVALSRTW
jgi:hypothetical protein